jgi:hypothetical protein
MTNTFDPMNTLNLPSDAPDIDETLRIDRLKIDEEFTSFPAVFWYYLARQAEAVRQVEAAKIQLKRGDAALYERIRAGLEQDPLIKRVTEAMVDSAVTTSDEWREARDNLADLELRRRTLDAACEALRAKKDMLVQLGARARAELEREPRVNETGYQG